MAKVTKIIVSNANIPGNRTITGTSKGDEITIYPAVTSNLFIDGGGNGDVINIFSGPPNGTPGKFVIETVKYYANDVAYVGRPYISSHGVSSSNFNILNVSGPTQPVNLKGNDLLTSLTSTLVGHKPAIPFVTGFSELDLTNASKTSATIQTVNLDALGVAIFTAGAPNNLTRTASTMIIKSGPEDIINMGTGWQLATSSHLTGYVEYTHALSAKTVLQNFNGTVTLLIQNQLALISGNAAGSVAEDGVIVSSGKLNVIDVNAGQGFFKVISSQHGTYGNFSIDKVGNWKYTLNNASSVVQSLPASAHPLEKFTVSSLDGSATRVVNITVNGKNDVPVARNDGTVATTNSDMGKTILGTTLLANDTDVDKGTILRIASISGDSHFSLVSGNIVFKPGTDFIHLSYGVSQLVSFSYKTSDQFGALSNSATASIKVIGINDPPVARNDGTVAITDQNTAKTILGKTLLANDTDVNGNALHIGLVTGDSHFSLVNGNVVFTPGADFKYLALGDYKVVTFNYKAADQYGALSNLASASIRVNGLNDAPVACNDVMVATTNQNTGKTILGTALLANDRDVDNGSVVHIASVTGDSHVSLVNGNIVFNPGTDFKYVAQDAYVLVNFTYKVVDQYGALSNSATASIKVTGINESPIAYNDVQVASVDANAGTPIPQAIFLANDTDADAGAVLRIDSITESPYFYVYNGNVIFVPRAEVFDHLAQGASQIVSFSYRISDQFGALSNFATASIKVVGVNDAPIAYDDAEMANTDGKTEITISAAALLANDTDPDDGHKLSIYSIYGDSHFSLVNGNVVFTPGTDFDSLPQGMSQVVSFYYMVKDEFGALSDYAQAYIRVTGVNDKPVAVDDGQVALTGSIIEKDALLGNDTDVDLFHTLKIASVSGDPHISLSPYGDLVFTPGTDFDHLAQGQSADVNFSYIVSDEFGALSLNSAKAFIKVVGVNDAPVAVVDGQVASTDENTGITILASALLGNDTDADDGHILRIASVSDSPYVSLDINGNVVFTPGAAFDHLAQGTSQVVNFSYITQDEFGAPSNPVTDSILVTGLNDDPVAVADGQAARTDDKTAITILGSALLGNDTDADDGHILSLDSVSGDSHISLVNGNVVFTPGTDFRHLAVGAFKDVEFSYVIKDEHGATSNSATAFIRVTGVNDAPVAPNDVQVGSTDENTPKTFLASAILDHVTDVDDGHQLSIIEVRGDPHVFLDRGNVLFVPGVDFHHVAQGSYEDVSFTYVVMDEWGALSDPATAFIRVTGINDKPIAVADNEVASTDENTVKTISAATLLGNDTDVDDGHSLSIASVSGSPYVSLDSNGDVVFNPGTAFDSLRQGVSLVVSFSYIAKDEFGAVSDPVLNYIRITGVNDAAIFTGDLTGEVTQPADDHTSVSVGGILAVSDVDQGENSLVASPVIIGDYGRFFMYGSGSWTYILDTSSPLVQALGPGESRTETFTVHSVDGTAQNIEITVHGKAAVNSITIDNSTIVPQQDTVLLFPHREQPDSLYFGNLFAGEGILVGKLSDTAIGTPHYSVVGNGPFDDFFQVVGDSLVLMPGTSLPAGFQSVNLTIDDGLGHQQSLSFQENTSPSLIVGSATGNGTDGYITREPVKGGGGTIFVEHNGTDGNTILSDTLAADLLVGVNGGNGGEGGPGIKISGGSGSYTINSTAGHDTIYGGNGGNGGDKADGINAGPSGDGSYIIDASSNQSSVIIYGGNGGNGGAQFQGGEGLYEIRLGAGNDIVYIGNGGNNGAVNGADGHYNVIGGLGYDTFHLGFNNIGSSISFTAGLHIDGGAGIATLVLDAPLATPTALHGPATNGQLINITHLDLTTIDNSVNVVTLTAADVLGMTPANTLFIEGTDQSTVHTAGWTLSGSVMNAGLTYDHYTQGSSILNVEQSVIQIL